MKKFTTILLIGALTSWPMHRPQAQLATAICLVIVAVAAVGGVAVVIKSCRPRYYCVEDHETANRWCRLMDRADLVDSNLKIISGPYKDATYCEAVCTNQLPVAQSLSLLHIEKSSDLTNWVECAAIPFDEVFEWSETNAVNSACFYRAYLSNSKEAIALGQQIGRDK